MERGAVLPQENPMRAGRLSPPSKPAKPSKSRQHETTEPVFDEGAELINDNSPSVLENRHRDLNRRSISRTRERDLATAQKYLESMEEGISPPSSPPSSLPNSPLLGQSTMGMGDISSSADSSLTSTYRPSYSKRNSLNNGGSVDNFGNSTRASQRVNSVRTKSNLDPTASAAPSVVAGAKNAVVSSLIVENIIQYGLWAHYLSYGAAAMCLCMGVFAVAWTDAQTYQCKVDNQSINTVYLQTSSGVCPTKYQGNSICCDPKSTSSLQGSVPFGLLYIGYGIFIIPFENTSWGYGLWFPPDSILFRNRISVIGLLHLAVGVCGLFNYATCLPGSFLLAAGLAYSYAAWRREKGDGGRDNAAKAKAKGAGKGTKKPDVPLTLSQRFSIALSYNPVSFFSRIYKEDKLSSYFWVFVFLGANIAVFAYTVYVWDMIVATMKKELLNGTLDVFCKSTLCHTNRKVVRYGPISFYGALAKGCGVCLNLNGSLLLLPVIRHLLRQLNNAGESFNALQHSSSTDYFAKVFAHPLTRYVPLQKNIEFHKICAMTIFLFSWLHMVFHYINLIYANNATLRLFRMWGWDGTAYLTGAVVSFAMLVIYSAAPDEVRRTKYEIFYNAHHFFVVFFLVMFLHGPNFFYWCALPVCLYIGERLLRLSRGNTPFLLVKVEWISPVMALYFRPVFKEDFKFKEGQYLYLNCPHVSTNEWHPFTISSAPDDLKFGPRIHLLSGEEVAEVPRPRGLPSGVKWSKFCKVSQVPNDWSELNENQLLDKSDTGYHDYVSVHIKVHGLEEQKARTWTRKVKEYLELLSPQKKFPFYFKRLDDRGDVSVGKRVGPDNLPIIRVDGPHSAPSEHFCNYGTVMIVGAGIGLTPCASILSSLTKYKWRKNFSPEIVHLYWVVRQNEVDSFQWLVHMLTELSFELRRAKATNQISARYYCEVNIYVTAVEKGVKEVPRLSRPPRTLANTVLAGGVKPLFTAEELFKKLLNPTVESKGQAEKMSAAAAENRLQDIWIWNGRPHWPDIFAEMLKNRQHSDIGVCFCGAPAIGADLAAMCEKYSSVEEDCLFTLHKENF